MEYRIIRRVERNSEGTVIDSRYLIEYTKKILWRTYWIYKRDNRARVMLFDLEKEAQLYINKIMCIRGGKTTVTQTIIKQSNYGENLLEPTKKQKIRLWD